MKILSLLGEKRKNRTKINHRGKGFINFIDVGSVGGLSPPWNRHAQNIRLLLNFEPRDEPVFTDTVITDNCALWNEPCERPFYIYKGFNQTGSSLLKQNDAFVKENFATLKSRGPSHLAETWFERSQLERQTTVQCRRLDDVVASLPESPQFDILKIDAQGAEYQILQGAERLLSNRLAGLHLELFTIPLYEGVELLDDVCRVLDTFGFTLAKQFPAHGTFDSQHDCLFLRKGDNGRIAEAIKAVYAPIMPDRMAG